MKWQAPIRQLLAESDFDDKMFCTTRFPQSAEDDEYLDPVADVIPAARTSLRAHGLTLHVASDRALDENLCGNIAAHMRVCRYASPCLRTAWAAG